MSNTTRQDGDTPAQAMIKRKSRRAVANIMDTFDRDVKARLVELDGVIDMGGATGANVAARFRSVLLREIGDLTETACFLANAERDGAVVNELALDVVAEARHDRHDGGDGDEPEPWNLIDHGSTE